MNETNPPDNTLAPVSGSMESVAAVPVDRAGSGTTAVRGAVKKSSVSMFDPFGLRMLIISWCLWLLVSWSITLTIGATVHAVRWVVFSGVFGLMAVWPALRLSQQLPGRDARGLDVVGGQDGFSVASPRARVLATLMDWVCLLAVFQVVVWPLMLVGRWSVQQTLWLDAAVLAWSMLTAVLVGLGRVLPWAQVRVVAMVLCMLLLIGEPIWMAVSGGGFDGAIGWAGGGRPVWQMRISPMQALWELTTTEQPYDPGPWRPTILSTAAASGLGLGVLLMISIFGGSRCHPGPVSGTNR